MPLRLSLGIVSALAVSVLVAGVARVDTAAAVSQSPLRAGSAAPTAGYRVVHTYPHDRDAYTQGLEFVDGALFESTGLNGRSSIRKVQLETGRVLRRRDVPQAHFGEGITIWRSRMFELTWQSHVAFVYDSESFEPRGSFAYTGEGWGLTHDGTSLIMSDGTADLRFLDPTTFQERRRVRVTDAARPVSSLNELEYVNGQVFANVWTTDRIARIDPQTGRVLGWIDLAGLLSARDRVNGDAVLNGIAYDEKGARLFVTGKLWPSLFEITIVPRP
ncbi:MAG: glutaminyl-peptide cyclotransferase [Acidobacteriota bacterium]